MMQEVLNKSCVPKEQEAPGKQWKHLDHTTNTDLVGL